MNDNREMAPTSHGNTVVEHGDCPVCGRKGVPLTRLERRAMEPTRLVCANEFACFDAWEARDA